MDFPAFDSVEILVVRREGHSLNIHAGNAEERLLRSSGDVIDLHTATRRGEIHLPCQPVHYHAFTAHAIDLATCGR